MALDSGVAVGSGVGEGDAVALGSGVSVGAGNTVGRMGSAVGVIGVTETGEQPTRKKASQVRMGMTRLESFLDCPWIGMWLFGQRQPAFWLAPVVPGMIQLRFIL